MDKVDGLDIVEACCVVLRQVGDDILHAGDVPERGSVPCQLLLEFAERI